MQEVVERIWDFIDDFNINSVLKFLKDNVVGTVVVVSLIFWIPVSCLISYVDNKRAKKVRQFNFDKVLLKTVDLKFICFHEKYADISFFE